MKECWYATGDQRGAVVGRKSKNVILLNSQSLTTPGRGMVLPFWNSNNIKQTAQTPGNHQPVYSYTFKWQANTT
jgi:hypothetical protein